jgi:hypothetical protein
MRRCLLFVALGVLAVALGLVGVLALALEGRPRIDRPVAIGPQHVERAMQIVDAHRYRTAPGTLAEIEVLPEDADLAANYVAHRFLRGSARLALGDGTAQVLLSMPAPRILPEAWLNLDATLAETAGLPQLRSLRVGRLPVPGWLALRLGPAILDRLGRGPEFADGLDALRQVRMSPAGLRIVYGWKDGLPPKGGAALFDAEERERLRRYQSLLAAESRRAGSTRVSLADVLPLLFRLAGEQSAKGDAIAENRAAILVATWHALGRPLHELVPEAATWPRPRDRTVTLDGRDDFAKHFLVSATIAAYADTVLADAVGLYKEIEDSRSGSGFSFTDIAADRAGTRFGELAVADADSARRLQRRVATGMQDSDAMPRWKDLPEYLPEAVFVRRFGGVDGPGYTKTMQEIERRVSALRMLR